MAKRNCDTYDYIAVYVDDFCLAMKDPKAFVEKITGPKYNFKLKGVGPLSYHLGASYKRDPDGTLTQGSKRYIEKMHATYKQIFGEEPTVYSSPLEHGDHPELDDSEYVDSDGIGHYQTMIGQLQWVIALGRFDVFTATMSISRYRISPRIGHLDRLKRIYGNLKRDTDGRIRFRVDEPDMSGLPTSTYSWDRSIYGNVR